MHVETILPVPYTGRGIGYTCGELLKAMGSPGLTAGLTTPYAAKALPSNVALRQTLPGPVGRLAFRYAKGASKRWTETMFLRALRRGPTRPVAYLWSDTSLAFAENLKRRGVVVVREKTNCGKALGKRVLDDAYRRLGVAPQHGLTDEAVAEEARRLMLADAIYCPNPLVEQSLEEIGIPASRRLPTSYGFDPARFCSKERLLEPIDGITFVFVGTICVRKGAHLILEAWAKSGIKGRLVLAGAMEPLIGELCAAHLARPDVVRLSYVTDVAALYNSADVFVFPTLEEGGPQVTYEAAFCGLPTLVSPMGAGHLTRHGEEGYVIDPYDADGWIDAMRHLADSAGIRREMGDKAKARSLSFTWQEVGRQRGTLLSRHLAR